MIKGHQFLNFKTELFDLLVLPTVAFRRFPYKFAHLDGTCTTLHNIYVVELTLESDVEIIAKWHWTDDLTQDFSLKYS